MRLPKFIRDLLQNQIAKLLIKLSKGKGKWVAIVIAVVLFLLSAKISVEQCLLLESELARLICAG